MHKNTTIEILEARNRVLGELKGVCESLPWKQGVFQMLHFEHLPLTLNWEEAVMG